MLKIGGGGSRYYAMNDDHIGISVLIPTYNGEGTIHKTIEPILSQEYEGELEIIVVNDCSTDSTLKVAQQYPVEIINNEKNLGLACSVNRGVKASKNKIVCVIHEDIVLIDKEWFKKLVPYLMSNEDVAIVTSPVVLPKSVYDTFGFWEKALFSWEVNDAFVDTVTDLDYSDGKNDIFKKELFLNFGGFDGDTYRVACEDVDLSKRLQKAGYRILSVPVPVSHIHSSHARGLPTILFKKNPRLSEGQGVLFREHGFIGGWNNVIFKTAAIVCLFIPSNIIRILGLLYIASIIFGCTYISFKQMRDWKVVILLPPVKLVDYILNVICFWKGFITKKQTL